MIAMNEYFKQPMLKKWNLKYSMFRATHSNFKNWEGDKNFYLQSLRHITYSTNGGTYTNVDDIHRRFQKAVYVMGRRWEPRNWKAQYYATEILWDIIGWMMQEENCCEEWKEVLFKRLRYAYTKEEYPYGREG